MVNQKMPEYAGKHAQIIAFGDRNTITTTATKNESFLDTERVKDSLYSTAGTGTTPGARARAYRSDFSEALGMLTEYYCDTFDRSKVARVVMGDMISALEAGMEPEVIILAMDDTARCEKPTWAYTLAILRRCIREGILTAEQWERQKEQRSAGRARGNAGASKSAPQNSATAYTQRAYNDADYAGDAIMDMWRQRGTL